MKKNQVYNQNPNSNQLLSQVPLKKASSSPNEKYHHTTSQVYYNTTRSEKDSELLEILNKKRNKSTTNNDTDNSIKKSCKSSGSLVRDNAAMRLTEESNNTNNPYYMKMINNQNEKIAKRKFSTGEKKDKVYDEGMKTYSGKKKTKEFAVLPNKSRTSFNSSRKQHLKTEEYTSPGINSDKNYVDTYFGIQQKMRDLSIDRRSHNISVSDRNLNYDFNKKSSFNETQQHTEIEKLKIEASGLKNTNELLQAENQNLKKKNGIMKTEIDVLENDLGTSRQINEEMTERTTQKVEYIDRLEGDLVKLRKKYTKMTSNYKSLIDYVKVQSPLLGQGLAFTMPDFKIKKDPQGTVDEENKQKTKKIFKNLPDITDQMKEVDETLEDSEKTPRQNISDNLEETPEASLDINAEMGNLVDNNMPNFVEFDMKKDDEFYAKSEENFEAEKDNVKQKDKPQDKIVILDIVEPPKLTEKDNNYQVKSGILDIVKFPKEIEKHNNFQEVEENFTVTFVKNEPNKNEILETKPESSETVTTIPQTPKENPQTKKKIEDSEKTILKKKKPEKDPKKSDKQIDEPKSLKPRTSHKSPNTKITENHKKTPKKSEPKQKSQKEVKAYEPQRNSHQDKNGVNSVAKPKNVKPQTIESNKSIKPKATNTQKTNITPKNLENLQQKDFSKKNIEQQIIKKPVYYNLNHLIKKDYGDVFSSSPSSDTNLKQTISRNASNSLEKYRNEHKLKLDTSKIDNTKKAFVAATKTSEYREENVQVISGVSDNKTNESYKFIDPQIYEVIDRDVKQEAPLENSDVGISPIWTQLKKFEDQRDNPNNMEFGLIKLHALRSYSHTDETVSQNRSPLRSPGINQRDKPSNHHEIQPFFNVVKAQKKDNDDQLLLHAQKNINNLPSSQVIHQVNIETGEEQIDRECSKDLKKIKENKGTPEKKTWGKRRLHTSVNNIKNRDMQAKNNIATPYQL